MCVSINVICLHIFVYICVYVYIYIYIYTYICLYAYTYIRIYIHMYLCMCVQPGAAGCRASDVDPPAPAGFGVLDLGQDPCLFLARLPKPLPRAPPYPPTQRMSRANFELSAELFDFWVTFRIPQKTSKTELLPNTAKKYSKSSFFAPLAAYFRFLT